MFQVSTDALRSVSFSIRDGSNQLNRNCYEIEDVKGMICGMSGMADVIATLNGLKDNVRLEARQEEAIYETAQMIARRYEACEEGIIENMDNGKFGFGITTPRISIFGVDRADKQRIDTKVLKELLGLFN